MPVSLSGRQGWAALVFFLPLGSLSASPYPPLESYLFWMDLASQPL